MVRERSSWLTPQKSGPTHEARFVNGFEGREGLMLELAPNRCEDDLNEDFGLIKVEVVLFDWLLATACGFAAAFFLFSEVCCWTLF